IRGLANSEQITTTRAAHAWKQIFRRTKQHLHLADSTPIVMVGFSRGASAVAFCSVHPDLRDAIKGAVAIALTREADYLHASEEERLRGLEVAREDRILLYPALKLLGSTPLAVIQSTNDSYVPAAESRKLLGPDTPSLRLYEVEAKNHRFGGAHDKMMADVDDALGWILQHQTRAAN